MLNMLLEGEGTNFFTQYGLLIILVAMLVLMFAFSFFRQRRANLQEEHLREHMLVGTKVKTYAGIYGTIVGFYDTTDGRVARLSLDGKTVMEVDFRSIYCIDEKKEITEEEVAEEKPVEEQVETKAEVKSEAKVEEKIEVPVEVGEKPAKKRKTSK